MWNVNLMKQGNFINKITLLHQVGIPHYFMWKIHSRTTLKLLFIIF